MFTVIVYDIYNNTHKWDVRTIEKAHEYAKRIITEGLWFHDGEDEIFMPVHQVVKVKVVKHDAGKEQP